VFVKDEGWAHRRYLHIPEGCRAQSWMWVSMIWKQKSACRIIGRMTLAFRQSKVSYNDRFDCWKQRSEEIIAKLVIGFDSQAMRRTLRVFPEEALWQELWCGKKQMETEPIYSSWALQRAQSSLMASLRLCLSTKETSVDPWGLSEATQNISVCWCFWSDIEAEDPMKW
jgi:hypothetical protein